ncbi:transposase [Oligoflexus tunisiensis]|uniref:transposase n=1 Tax=Oligoflexus tunisiensis TaxID=708132 RepID=UPI00159F078D|nr:transposase [Oligoflexus tunisiensis]
MFWQYIQKSGRDGSKSRKYIVSSNTAQAARETVQTYRNRWAIESWLKDMKQNHGYGDCRSANFKAFEAHINFCLTAYNLQRCNEAGIPRPGTTVAEFVGVQKLCDGARSLNQVHGVQRLKKAANEALAEITTWKAAQAAA